MDMKTKIECETQDLKEMIEKIVELLKHQFDAGLDSVDTDEAGKVADIILDLCTAKEKMVKGCYYTAITEAMEDADYGEDYDSAGPMRKGYRGQPRRMNGQFKSRGYDEVYNVHGMDDRMYYDGSSDGGYSRGYSDGMRSSRRDYREGNAGRSRMYFAEAKEEKPEDKKERMKRLEKWMNDLEKEIPEMVADGTPEERVKARQTLSNIMGMI